MIHDVMPGTEHHLNKEMTAGYIGFDPTADSLHIGNLVQIMTLVHFQQCGHKPIALVGGATGMVGDPSGRSVTRKQLTAEQTAANSATYFDQVMRILDPDRVEVRRNSEWLAGMTLADVVRETSVLTVAKLLERDDFAKRYAAHQPISLSEFLYPFLQGYDSVAVQADVELGGTDQTYNLLVGRDLQRAHRQPQQVVLTMPLLEGLDGTQKMSKSLGNYVAITEPPAEQFGKLMSIPDSLIVRYATLGTDLAPAEITELAAEVAAGGPRAGAAKRRVAAEIVRLYHGGGGAAAAEAAFDRRFKEREVPDDVPEYVLPADDPVHLPALLREAGLAGSTSDARRALAAGSVRLDGARLDAAALDVPRADLVGKVLQVGKRKAARLAG